MKMIGSLSPTAKGGHASSLSNRTMIQAISFGLIKTFRHKKHRPTANKSLPLKHEYFLFRDQEDRCAAGRNRNCISDRLFATLRCGAGLQSLHGGEMDLCNAMEGWCPLRGTDYFARHNFRRLRCRLGAHKSPLT